MSSEPLPAAQGRLSVWSRLARLAPRLYRLGVLAAIAWLLHMAAIKSAARGELTVADARSFFPQAQQLDEQVDREGAQLVRDAAGNVLGKLLITSPEADDLIGYSGPSNLLVALDPDGKIVGIEIISSGDTRAHVDEVRRSSSFWGQLIGWQPTGKPAPQVEGVSGSTLTSLAMAEGVARRLRGSGRSLRFPEPVTLEEVQVLFPQARRLAIDQLQPGWQRVEDERGKLLGFAVRSSPYSDNVRGYRGPTETLAAISPDRRRVLDVRLRKSYDTPEYVDRVREDDDYRRLLSNRTTDEWANIDFREAGIEGVSGATQTSFAMAEGLHRTFAASEATPRSPGATRFATPGLLAIILGALGLTFTPLRTQRRIRWFWNGVLVVVFALWIGDLLSLALVVGWARHGIPWESTPAAVLLVAVALVVPWVTRRNVYCHHICPHGAAQAWLGRFKRLHVRIPGRWNRWLTKIPAALLVVAFALATLVVGFDLALLEPFDAWVLKGAAAVSAVIAVVGLVASLFVPLAYCRFGCPTGELLRYLKSGGQHDRFTRRDWVAAALILGVAAIMFAPRISALSQPPPPVVDSEPPSPDFRGRAFGTIWSVKLREPPPVEITRTKLAAELERIESTLSHWRPESATAQFNAIETTFESEQPAELVMLVNRALEISRATAGAYDITVAPLVSAWGFGPAGEIEQAPSEETIQELLARTGYQKLHADGANNTLSKDHPQLQIDLGSLLQGYAADKLAELLTAAGVEAFLIDVGGELVARGQWQVAVENPADSHMPLRRVTLKDVALATSGLYRANRELAGQQVHHLIDPKTGRPFVATARLCAVAAPTGLEADAWATALLAVGLPDSLHLANEQGLAVLLLDNEGRVHPNETGKKAFADP